MIFTKLTPFISIFITAILSSFIALSFHIFALHELASYANAALINVKILKPPYPTYVNIFAYITAILPGLGLAIFYYLIEPYLSIKSKFLRGIILGIFLLLIKGELIRQPLMNILVGNPVSIVLLQQSQVWLSSFIMSLSVVYLLPISVKISK